MRHLDDGVLRRMIDEPIAIRDSERRHFQSCPGCHDRLTVIEADAQYSREWMDRPTAAVDSAASLARLQNRIAAEGLRARSRRTLWTSGLPRRAQRGFVAGVAVLAMAGALAFTPAGSLAQDLITIFQPSQVTPLAITAGDMQTLQQLTQYGTLSGPANTPAREVGGPSAASDQSGMTVFTPSSLPADIPPNVKYSVLSSETATFTFSAAKARAAAAASGQTLPPMPAEIDGSTLQLTTGEGVVAVYSNGGGGIPNLVIGQMRRPTLTARGVTVRQLEDYLLTMPGISEQLKAQIKSIGDPTTALPIPVPVDGAYSHAVQVQGIQGLVVGDSTGVGSGVVWEKDGIIYGVAGPLSEDEVLSIANGLH